MISSSFYSRGWKLGIATRQLIFGDKGLLVYPIIGGIITFLFALALFVPLVLTISTAQSGRFAERITEKQLVEILSRLTYRPEPKIEFKRK